MPKRQTTAQQRAREAARAGGKYTSARAQQRPSDQSQTVSTVS
jgi:hypothetical protein